MFEKAVLVNIDSSGLRQPYWDKLDTLVKQKVLLKRDDPKLLGELKDCDVLLLGFQVPIGKEIFDAAPKLKMINILATAYGSVDLEEAKKRNITVCNLGGYSTESVAEFVVAALLSELRGLKEGFAHAESGDYGFGDLRVRELKDSNFGVIGLGEIGNRVAEIAAGFGANVSYYSRTKRDSPFAYRDLDSLLKESDFISVNVAETPESVGLLNSSNLPLLRSDSVLISTVPPAIIETNALIDRLSKGDVLFISDHPYEMTADDLGRLKALKNVVLYPSIAYISDEARLARQETFISNIEDFLKGDPQHIVL